MKALRKQPLTDDVEVEEASLSTRQDADAADAGNGTEQDTLIISCGL